MTLRTLMMAGMVSLLPVSAAQADCAFENETPVKVLSAGFEAWKAVTDAMAECGNVDAELDQEFRTKQPAAFAANPSLYHIGGVANGTITPLLNEGTIRPLDDLVAEYGENLAPNQLIKVDGQTMAIAMMVNTQHLMYRQDIFDELGLEVPTTWDEALEVAAQIEEADVVDYPLGATMKSGWNLAQDFNNMFLGYGGQFTDAESMPTVNTEAGVNALEMMKALTEYMDPEYLVSDSTYVQQQFQQGKIAMANLWASRGAAMDDEAESQVVGKVNAAAAPLAMEGGAPATTLWWDGIVIARNISDEQAQAAFRVAMEGLDTEMVKANNDAAIWLISGYQPNRLAEGAIATASAEPAPPSYPSTSQMGLMHTALGNELPAFFTGERDAEATLAAVEDAYITAAQEAGLIE
ncbi:MULTISPECIES: extracellular solute-binding protein [unclassified Roseitalea]|uniref:ABC transporter substrate-binding protein n=1 Tax=unclassified Roseitalea TaxID=2639107 RepID=UPI00273F890E|nr:MULTISPECIES: extracellular solute-binding protein [unclassified Roseitalea]